MKQVFLCCCVICAFLGGCEERVSRPPEIVKVPRVIPYYVVREGDTIGSIATKHNMTRAELIKINRLKPPYQLYNGQRLVIKVQCPDDLNTISQRSHSDAFTEDMTARSAAIADDLNGLLAGRGHPRDSKTDSDAEEEDDSSETEIEEETKVFDKEWPIAGARQKIFQHFGESKIDEGIILRAPAGTPVRSVAAGVVKLSGFLEGDATAYGYTVIIQHDKLKMISVYSHLQSGSVKVGDRVKKGTKIGSVGNTGKAKSPQLYLELFDTSSGQRTSVDPEKKLP
jgi:murein DD-endopeptidase MepM/ murein hydrolase activator NlpD